MTIDWWEVRQHDRAIPHATTARLSVPWEEEDGWLAVHDSHGTYSLQCGETFATLEAAAEFMASVHDEVCARQMDERLVQIAPWRRK